MDVLPRTFRAKFVQEPEEPVVEAKTSSSEYDSGSVFSEEYGHVIEYAESPG